MHKNEMYNDFLNSSDVVLGMSGGEGWGLPEFQSACLGKHAVLLNASAYKDWANEENAVLVEPSGNAMYDGVFFLRASLIIKAKFTTSMRTILLAAAKKLLTG